MNEDLLSTASPEAVRLAALRRYGILDTAPEASFDDIAVIATHLCKTPIALVSLVDEHRQWFKARAGIDLTETPRSWSFCSVAIEHDDPVFEVVDATQDQRFADNPLVTADGGIRFYAGAPLIAPDGEALGTLCVIDDRPRALDAAQRDALAALSRIVIAQLESSRLSRSLLAVTSALERLATLSSATGLEEAGRQVTMLASEVLACDGAVLLLADGVEKRTLDPYGALAPTPELVTLAQGLRIDTARATGAAAASARLGEAMFTPDMSRSTVADAELADLLGMASAYCLPLADVEGVLLVWWSEPLAVLDADARTLMQLLGVQAGPHLSRLLTMRQLQSEASTDALTGLPNRRSVRAHLMGAEPGAAVAILDLDHFKAHNDTYGHAAGDEVLREFAGSLTETVRTGDAIGRWGGEEFVLVVDAGLDAAERVLSRLRLRRDGRSVTFSGGIARVEPGESGVEALVRADRALYEAKAAGRDRTASARREQDDARV